VHRFSEPSSSSDLQTAKSFLSEQTPTFIQPLSEESIAGYALLEDIYGKPALVLKVDTPRSIYGQGQATLRYLILSILAVALAFSVVIMLALNRLVLTPLSQLNDNVNDIGKSGDPSRRVSVTGRDEFANLAGAINETLASMEEFQNELQTSEKKYRVLVENANEAIIVTQDGLLKYVNPKTVEIAGYSKEELTSRPFVEFIPQMISRWWLNAILKGFEVKSGPPVILSD
jgi:signal transduction histidine kinase